MLEDAACLGGGAACALLVDVLWPHMWPEGTASVQHPGCSLDALHDGDYIYAHLVSLWNCLLQVVAAATAEADAELLNLPTGYHWCVYISSTRGWLHHAHVRTIHACFHMMVYNWPFVVASMTRLVFVALQVRDYADSEAHPERRREVRLLASRMSCMN